MSTDMLLSAPSVMVIMAHLTTPKSRVEELLPDWCARVHRSLTCCAQVGPGNQ
jgi:hypothetical protein